MELRDRYEYRFITKLSADVLDRLICERLGLLYLKRADPWNVTVYLGNLTYPWFPPKGTMDSRLRIRMRFSKVPDLPFLVFESSELAFLDVKKAQLGSVLKTKCRTNEVPISELVELLKDQETFRSIDPLFHHETYKFSEDDGHRRWNHSHGFVPKSFSVYERREYIHPSNDLRLTVDIYPRFGYMGILKDLLVGKVAHLQESSVVELKLSNQLDSVEQKRIYDMVCKVFASTQAVQPAVGYAKFDITRRMLADPNRSLQHIKLESTTHGFDQEYEIKFDVDAPIDMFKSIEGFSDFIKPSFRATLGQHREQKQQFWLDLNEPYRYISYTDGAQDIKFKKQLSSESGLIISSETFYPDLPTLLETNHIVLSSLIKAPLFVRRRMTIKLLSLQSGYTYTLVSDQDFLEDKPTVLLRQLEVEFSGMIVENEREIKELDVEIVKNELKHIGTQLVAFYAARTIKLRPSTLSKAIFIVKHMADIKNKTV